MKKFALTLVSATACMLSSAAMAETYVSGAVGQGHANLDCAGTTSCNNNGTAIKLTGGYGFGHGWSAELGYITFGKATASVDGVDAEFKASAFTLGAAYELPMNPEWNLGMRLGIASVKTEIGGTVPGVGSGSDSATKVQPYFGIGVNYAVAKNVKVEAGFDFTKAEYDSSLNANVRAITIGARFSF